MNGGQRPGDRIAFGTIISRYGTAVYACRVASIIAHIRGRALLVEHADIVNSIPNPMCLYVNPLSNPAEQREREREREKKEKDKDRDKEKMNVTRHRVSAWSRDRNVCCSS